MCLFLSELIITPHLKSEQYVKSLPCFLIIVIIKPSKEIIFAATGCMNDGRWLHILVGLARELGFLLVYPLKGLVP